MNDDDDDDDDDSHTHKDIQHDRKSYKNSYTFLCKQTKYDTIFSFTVLVIFIFCWRLLHLFLLYNKVYFTFDPTLNTFIAVFYRIHWECLCNDISVIDFVYFPCDNNEPVSENKTKTRKKTSKKHTQTFLFSSASFSMPKHLYFTVFFNTYHQCIGAGKGSSGYAMLGDY